MVSPDYNDKPEEAYQYELIDWTVICQYCLKPISATRPPIYNEANCACSELGNYAAKITPVTRPDAQTSKPNTTVYKQPAYTYQCSAPEYVSSHTQTTTPREELLVDETSNSFQSLSINWNDWYFKSPPGFTQDGPYSVQSYSWPLRSWLSGNESSCALSSIPRNSSRVYESSSLKAKKGSKRGNSSIHSSESDVESVIKGWGPDPLTEAGAWVKERYQEGNGHTLVMSGIGDSNGA